MAMDDTGGGSGGAGGAGGSQVETLGLNVALSGAQAAEQGLDSFAKAADGAAVATVKTMSSIKDLDAALEQASAQYEATRGRTKDLTDAQIALHRANKEAMEIAAARYEQGMAYLQQLEQMTATFNMATDELQRYKAVQAGVSAEAEVFIVQMKALRDATAEYGVVIKELSEIDKAHTEWQASNATVLNAQRIRETTEQAKLEESSLTSLNAQRRRALNDQASMEESASTALNAQRVRSLNDQAQLEESAQTSLNAQRVRALNDQAQLEESAATSLNAQRVRMLNDQATLEASAQASLNAQRIRSLNEQAAAEESATTALNAQRIRSINDQATAEESARTSLNAQRIRETNDQAKLEESSRTALNAQRIRSLNEAAAAEKAALEEQEKNQTIFQAFKTRTLNENRAEAARIREEMYRDAVAKAEKEAEEEIRWNMLSVKTRINQLQMLQQYMNNPNISQKTTEGAFSSAAFKDLPNLDALVKQYNESLKSHSKTLDQVVPKVKGWGDALSNNRVRTEALVLVHEALQGRFTRIPGSLMVMGEYLTSAGISMGAFMGTALGLAAAVAAVGYEMEKGYKQTTAFNDAINRTNGYSGETRDSLETLAQSVGKVHGEYTDAFKAATELTASGKFTAAQIDMITKSATDLSYAFGQDVNTTIKQFETLVAHGTSSGAAGMLQVTKAVEKLDEQYHFLTTSQMESIIQLEKEGKVREASAMAIKLFGDETQKEAKNAEEYIGWIELAWNKVTGAIKGTAQALADIGKRQTFAAREQTLVNQLDKNPDGTIKTDTDHMSVTNKYRLDQYNALQVEIAEYNKKAKEQAEQEQKNAEANHVLSMRAVEDVRLMKKTHGEMQDALDKNEEQLKTILAADPGYFGDPKNVQYESDRVQAIIKAHTEKAKSVKDDGRKQELLDQLNANEQGYKLVQEASDHRIKMAKDLADQGQTSRQSEYDDITAAYKRQLEALDAMERAKIHTLEAYKPKNDTDAAENIKRINDVKRAYQLSAAEIHDALVKSQQDVVGKAVKEVSTVDEKQINALNTQIENQKKYNAEIGKTAEQKKEALAQLDDEKVIATQVDLVYWQSIADNKENGVVEQAAANKRVADLQRYIDKLKEKRDLENTGAALEAQAALDKLWAQTDKKLSDDIASAIIDGGGRGYKKLIRDMELAFAKLILQPIIAPIAAGITSILYPGATQAGGVGAAEGGSTVSGAIGAANAAANAYKMVSTGFASLSAGNLANYAQMGLDKVGASSLFNSAAPSVDLATGVTGNGAMAGALGHAGSTAAGYMIGSTLNSAISGQYSTGSGLMTVEKIGTAVASYFGPEFGALAGAISGLVNRAFGMGPTQLKASGIKGTLSDSGVTGNAYSDYHEDGGWFRSDKNWTDSKALTPDVMNSFTSGLTTMKTTMSGLADVLGVGNDALKDYSKSFDILLTPLKEVTGSAAQQAQIVQENQTISQQNADAIAKFFTSVGDDMASKLIPNINEFALAGETASTTLQRLNGVFAQTNSIATMLGKTSAQMFGGTGLGSDKARESLIALAGGASNLSAYTQSYAKNFLTNAQQMAPAIKAVSDAMGSLGLASVTTRQQFADEIASLDLTKDADQKLFISLMQLQDAFATVTPAIDDSTLTVTDAHQRLVDAYKNESDAIKQTQDNMKKLGTTLRDLEKSSLLGDLSPLTPEQKYAEAKSQFDKVSADAKNGNADAQAGFSTAYQNFLTASKAVNASGDQYQRDFAYAQQSTEQLAKYADTQVDVATASLAALNKQVDGLITINDSVVSVAQAIKDLAVAMGKDPATFNKDNNTKAIGSLYQGLLNRAPDDAGLAFWQNQLSNGTSINDVSSAITQSGEYQNEQQLEDLYQSMFHRAADPAGLAYWQQQMAGGVPLAQVKDAFTQSSEYNGTLASASGTGSMSGLSVDPGFTESIVSAINSLQDSVEQLRSDQQQQTGDILTTQAQTSQQTAETIADATATALASVNTRVQPA